MSLTSHRRCRATGQRRIGAELSISGLIGTFVSDSLRGVEAALTPLPDDVAAPKALLAAATRRADDAEARLANAQARESATEAVIAHLKLQIAKLKREQYGASAERTRRLLEQMELQLEDLEADAAEDDCAAEAATAKTASVTAFERKRPSRKPFPDHLPRERVVIPAPCACPACGGERLSKLGEDVTETLEVIPRSWKVIQTVRERFSCRDCETITQPPAPFHVVPRRWAGPSFLAMLLFEKYGQHQPLNRQTERFAREGVPLSTSTLADQVGAATFALMPLYRLIEAHVLAAERLHGDDTTVPVMAKGKTDTARLWTYVRDDRPFAGWTRRRRCSITPVTEEANIHERTSPPGQGSCRPMPMAGTVSSMPRAASPNPSLRRPASLMPGGSSSSLPTWPPRPGA
jgi:transposase